MRFRKINLSLFVSPSVPDVPLLLIDTHAHLEMPAPDLPAVLERARDAVSSTRSIDLPSLRRSLDAAANPAAHGN
jgi:hypothetical protein